MLQTIFRFLRHKRVHYILYSVWLLLLLFASRGTISFYHRPAGWLWEICVQLFYRDLI